MGIAILDFETYSEAGYTWSGEKWVPVNDSGTPGIAAVGAPAYAEHPSTEVLCMAYRLPGQAARLWTPADQPPADLFAYIAAGGLVEAHNSGFEGYIWRWVCVPRMGWPELPAAQLRCSMSRSRAFGLPGALADVAIALSADEQKDSDGKRLIAKFCKPRQPTKKDPRTRTRPVDAPEDFKRLCDYCLQDIATEESISALLPPLPPDELELWQLDQRVNSTGVAIDLGALDDFQRIVDQLSPALTAELAQVTGGVVSSPSEVARIIGFLAGLGVATKTLDSDAVDALLAGKLPPAARRVLEIRKALGSASVKKLGAIRRRLNSDGRLRDLFQYCGAERTGRFAGRGPQPQNLPSSGPELMRCKDCGHYHGVLSLPVCLSCGSDSVVSTEWTSDAVQDVLGCRSLAQFRAQWPDVLGTIAGSLRGLFVAAQGHDFICSDYSAIEAVVLAELAGEQWRHDVFMTHGKIYEMSASKITGIPFEEFMAHKQRTGDHHPLRKKVGKVAELASGYQGGLGAWKAFGADKFMTDIEIQANVKAWREASPMIARFWGEVERAAIAAVRTGRPQTYRGITYHLSGEVLYCTLLSGRRLAYHKPVVTPCVTPWGSESWKLSHMINAQVGGWQRDNTYGGKLTENIVQATARDVLTAAMVRLDKAGYKVVLHVHDEIVTEVPEGWGSVEEMENIMSVMPEWAKGWPIRANGGWRAKRYRK